MAQMTMNIIGSVFMCMTIPIYTNKGGDMLKNEDELWQRLDEINVAKVFILFTVKKGKKDPNPIITIQSVMVTTNCGNNQIDWDNEIYSEKSFLTSPIQREFSEMDGKFDGMLVYNCGLKKVTISGTHTRKVREKFKREF